MMMNCLPVLKLDDIMTVEREFSETELRRYDGEDGPLYIAYQGIVYDVSSCPRWRSGMHERLHYPGLDLTSAMPQAPHAGEVFSRPCVKRVGVLKVNKT
jgi:predicted heme/steroid binding protein